jgi:hypothetical protein
MRTAVRTALLLALVAPAYASDPVLPADPGVDKARVASAIAKGADFLVKDLDKTMKEYGWASEGSQCDDVLILYALVKAGGTQRPEFQQVLDHCLQRKLSRTYQAAVLAMALEAHAPARHAGYIQNCAQYLIDSQCENGQWAYGKEANLPVPSLAPNQVATPDAGAGTGTGAARGNTRAKTSLTRRGSGGETGDNSNTQYALLGLRACEDAGFKIPFDTWRKALSWWINSQQEDGGWVYSPQTKENSYASMTEGGLGSLVICMHFLQRGWKTEEHVSKAFSWIASHAEIPNNPIGRHGGKSGFEYYHLYAMERAGMLTERESFGKNKWYAEGAEFLFKSQGGDGAWHNGQQFGHPVKDTCFAILFLTRATRPIVYSEPSR